jgi:hypothetical protein
VGKEVGADCAPATGVEKEQEHRGLGVLAPHDRVRRDAARSLGGRREWGTCIIHFLLYT